MKLKNIIKITSSFVVVLVLGVMSWQGYKSYQKKISEPIKVGVLHARTGTMAISEKSVIDATMLAIEEINAKGGLLGRQIKPIVVDTRSDWPYAAQMAEKLIKEDKVSVIFGCWTSACRKTVKPVFEKYNHLLFYPVQYEGLEASPNIIYTGAAPNQQIIPAVKWMFDNKGTRFFLVGSDYIFPQIANMLIKEQIKALGGEVVGEEYLLLGSSDVDPVIEKIKEAKSTVILNTINGDSNIAFFRGLKKAGITSDKIPVMSFSIAEDELRSLNIKDMVGNYSAWNYFQSLKTPENQKFVDAFKKRYGSKRVTDDPMEAAYFGVNLWAEAVREAQSASIADVHQKIKGRISFNAPEGNVYIDPLNQHTWKVVRIGKINSDGQFSVVWSSDIPIQPVPWPTYLTEAEADNLLLEFYNKWGKNWANMPSTPSKEKP